MGAFSFPASSRIGTGSVVQVARRSTFLWIRGIDVYPAGFLYNGNLDYRGSMRIVSGDLVIRYQFTNQAQWTVPAAEIDAIVSDRSKWWCVCLTFPTYAAGDVPVVRIGTETTPLTAVAVTTNTASTGTPNTFAGNMYIGGSQSLAGAFTGLIGGFACVDHVVTEAVQDDWWASGGQTPPAGAYLAWLFHDDTLPAPDESGNSRSGAATGAVAWVDDDPVIDTGPPPDPEPLPPEPPEPPDPWLFEAVDHDGTPLAELTPRRRRVTLGRRGRHRCEFTVAADIIDPLLDIGAVDVRVTYRGRVVMSGPLTGARVAIQGTTRDVTFGAVGVRELLGARYLPAGYAIEATEQATAAWNLIDHAQQLGDLGIVAGALPDSVARSRTWDTPVSVLAALDELADLDDGFDYSIDPAPGGGYVFTVWPGGHQEEPPEPLVLDLGRTVSAITADIDAGPAALVNEVTVTGAGGVSVTDDDAVSEADYRLRQRVIHLPDADDATVLGDTARGELARDARPWHIPRLELSAGHPEANIDRVRPGYRCTVEAVAGWYAMHGEYVVDEVAVTLTDEGHDQVSVTLAPLAGDP